MKNTCNACRNFILPAAGLLLAAMLVQAAGVSQLPARTPPAWLRDGVIYEIFPRDFSSAGDLNGVTAQLDRLKDLGVTILWLMPVNPIGEKLHKGGLGSPYAIKDYYAINPDYGTTNDLKRLVSEAHRRGLKVILDIVVNHTAWDNVLINSHPDFYKHDPSGKIIPPVPDWFDVAGLDYKNARLREYMIGMMKYWIQEFDLDGFRCDAAAFVPTDFWEQARVELEKASPDIGLLAEASEPELLVKAFDIDYSFPLRASLDDVLIKGAPALNLRMTWEDGVKRFPQGALHMRVSDDHDEARAIAKYGLRGALAAQVLMFSLDGVPLLYNGMEVGDATESGAPALFEKLPIFWSPKERPPLNEIYHGLIQLRKQYPAFRNHRVIWLHSSDDANLVALMRLDENDEFVVVINFSNRPIIGRVDVENSGEFKPVQISGMPKPPADDFPVFHLGGFEWRIYHRAVPK